VNEGLTLIKVSGDNLEVAALDICSLQVQRHDAALLLLKLVGPWREKMTQNRPRGATFIALALRSSIFAKSW
jgi:hypothetical protein